MQDALERVINEALSELVIDLRTPANPDLRSSVRLGLGDTQAAKLVGVSREAIRVAKRGATHPDPVRRVRHGSRGPAMAPGSPQAPQRGASAASPSRIAWVDGPEAAKARAAEALVEAHGVFETRAEAERHRDSFVARLKQIEFDLKSGAVVEIDQVAREVAAQFTSLRTRLLALPTEQAPHLFRAKSVPALEAALSLLVTRALEALTYDRSLSR